MAWTEPRTWNVAELVTAANMNTHVRDNLNATFHLLARKDADETRTSTTFTDDTDIVFAVAANEVWLFQGWFMYDGPSAADNKWQWTTPSGTTGRWAFHQYNSANGVAWLTEPGTVVTGSNLVSIANGQITATNGAGSVQGTMLSGIIAVGGTAGNVQLQWAQNAASATSTFYANSCLFGCQIA